MKNLIRFILSAMFLVNSAFAGTQTIIKADIIENTATIKNYLGAKGHFEKSANGVNAYADAAAATPVDGTGGSPSLTCTRTTSSPLAGDGSLLITKGASNRQGDGCSIDFTIDSKDQGKVLQGYFDYAIGSGTFADNDIDVWIYDVTNAALIAVAPYHIKNHTLTSDKFPFEFQTASNSTSYRLILHVASTSSLAYTLKLDDIVIGRAGKLYGSAVIDWVSYTPTGSWVSNTTYVGAWRKVGDSMFVQGKIALTGAPTSATLTINLPSGYTIDTSKLAEGSTANRTLPNSTAWIVSAGLAYTGNVSYSSTTAVQITTLLGSTSANNTGTVTQAIPGTFTNGDLIDFSFQVPIVGWSSSQVMSSDSDTRPVSLTVTKGSTQAVTLNTTNISFTTTVKDSHGAWNGTDTYTVPVSGDYWISAVELSDNAGSSALGVQAYVNGTLKRRISYSPAGVASIGAVLLVGLNAGDLITVRSTASVTLGAGGALTISRVSGPVQIAASDSVSALYTGIPTGSIGAAWNAITYPTKVKDSHGAYSSGTYTIQTPGTYSISALVNVSATFSTTQATGIGIYVDGVEKYTEFVYAGGSVTGMSPHINVHSIPLLAGQAIVIKVYCSGTTPSYAAATQNQFSIVRTGNY